MTLKGAINQLVLIRDSKMMPEILRPGFDKAIETILSDAEEKRYGTWEPIEEIPSIRKRFKRYCCSNCKKEGFDTWNFCPACGQKNREGEQE